MPRNTTRREFLKETALLGAAACAMRAAGGAAAAETAEGQLPKIKLGTLEVSRLILGSNPFFGFAHKPGDVGRKMQEYYTDERIMAVLDEAAEHGITAVWTPVYDRWVRLWNKYREKGGKLRTWIGQPDPGPEQMKSHITTAAKNGAKAICIQGVQIDGQVGAGRWDVIRGWLEHIHSFDLPAGMATHQPFTHPMAEEKKLPTDFYHQCFFQPENYSLDCRQKAIETIRKLDKPVVGYKVLAAGRIAPAEGFAFALKHLRPKDGMCVGVFPKDDPDQLAENSTLVRKLTGRAPA